MTLRIDLHTHSLASDGSDTPGQVVEKAAAARLDVLALTDHDTAAGWSEAAEAADRVGVRLVTGIEFSVTNEQRGQHLLGYQMDPAHPLVGEILRRAGTSREDRIDGLLAKLDHMGLGVDREYVFSLAGGVPSRNHVAAGMVQAGHVASPDEAFDRYLNEGKPAYVARYRPSIEEAILAIKLAGGVSVIAHPRDTRRGPGVSDARLAELKQAGLDGIEVDHQMHDATVRDALRATATDLGLIATGSSDYHGSRKVDHDLACNLTSPDMAEALLGSCLRR